MNELIVFRRATHDDIPAMSRIRLAVRENVLFEQGADSVHLTTGADTRADRFYAAQGWTRAAISETESGFRIFKSAIQPDRPGLPRIPAR